ncbi:hypothetical protein [Actinophytocola sp. KF-1]
MGTRQRVPLVAGAVAGLGVLVAAQFSVMAQLGVVTAGMGGGTMVELLVYTPLVVLALAVPVWHRFPRRSWVVLVVAGAVCTLPNQLASLFSPRDLERLSDPFVAVDAASRPLLVVGLLGAATAVYRSGRRRAGGVLVGATLTVPPLTTFVMGPAMFSGNVVMPVAGLVLVVVGTGVAVVAAVTAPPLAEPEPRPEWRVTLAGVATALAPVVFRWWPGPDPYGRGGDIESYFLEAEAYFLLVGLLVLGIGVVAAIAAGARVFVAGVAAGLLLGAVATLTAPAASDLQDVPGYVQVFLAVGAFAVGVVCALPRYRVVTGVSCLGLLVAGLLALYLMYSAGEPVRDQDVTNVLTPVLLAVTVIAVLSLFSSLGVVVLPSGAAPATFAGVAGAVAAGTAAIGASYAFDRDGDPQGALATYPPVMAFLVVAAALTLVGRHRWRARD